MLRHRMGGMTTRPHKYPVGLAVHNALLDHNTTIESLGADSSPKGPLYWVEADDCMPPYIAWEADLTPRTEAGPPPPP